MTKEDILAFRAVARHLNFTRAAETLFITQSSLSKKIARLEKELGVTLLTRTKQSVQLTNAGMVLYQASEGFLQHGQMIREAMRRVSEVGYLTLRIGILGTVLGRKFLPVLQQFQKENPRIHLQLSCCTFRELFHALGNAKCDVVLTSDLGLVMLPEIDMVTLWQSKNVLVLPRTHPWIKLKSKDFRRLRNATFIVLTPHASTKGYEIVQSICARWGFRPQKVVVCNTTDDALFLVQAGQGISILPAFDCPDARVYGLHYHPLREPEFQQPIVLAWNKNNRNSGIGIFKDFVLAFKKQKKLMIE